MENNSIVDEVNIVQRTTDGLEEIFDHFGVFIKPTSRHNHQGGVSPDAPAYEAQTINSTARRNDENPTGYLSLEDAWETIQPLGT